MDSLLLLRYLNARVRETTRRIQKPCKRTKWTHCFLLRYLNTRVRETTRRIQKPCKRTKWTH